MLYCSCQGFIGWLDLKMLWLWTHRLKQNKTIIMKHLDIRKSNKTIEQNLIKRHQGVNKWFPWRHPYLTRIKPKWKQAVERSDSLMHLQKNNQKWHQSLEKTNSRIACCVGVFEIHCMWWQSSWDLFAMLCPKPEGHFKTAPANCLFTSFTS